MNRTATFSVRLKAYRLMHDLTLAQMEEKTGVPAQTINRYELGQRIPKIDTAIEMADALNINPLWLQGYDVNIERPAPMNKDEPANQDLMELWKNLAPEDITRAKDFALGLIAAHKKPLDQDR